MDRHTGELVVLGGERDGGGDEGLGKLGMWCRVAWVTTMPRFESTLAFAGYVTSETDSPQQCLRFLILTQENTNHLTEVLSLREQRDKHYINAHLQSQPGHCSYLNQA